MLVIAALEVLRGHYEQHAFGGPREGAATLLAVRVRRRDETGVFSGLPLTQVGLGPTGASPRVLGTSAGLGRYEEEVHERPLPVPPVPGSPHRQERAGAGRLETMSCPRSAKPDRIRMLQAKIAGGRAPDYLPKP